MLKNDYSNNTINNKIIIIIIIRTI